MPPHTPAGRIEWPWLARLRRKPVAALDSTRAAVGRSAARMRGRCARCDMEAGAAKGGSQPNSGAPPHRSLQQQQRQWLAVDECEWRPERRQTSMSRHATNCRLNEPRAKHTAARCESRVASKARRAERGDSSASIRPAGSAGMGGGDASMLPSMRSSSAPTPAVSSRGIGEALMAAEDGRDDEGGSEGGQRAQRDENWTESRELAPNLIRSTKHQSSKGHRQ